MSIEPILKSVKRELLESGKEYTVLIEGSSVEGRFTAIFYGSFSTGESVFRTNDKPITIWGTGWSAWEASCKE